MASESIKIGLMGLGVVGSGVARILHEKGEALSHQVGRPLEIKRVLVRNPQNKRAYTPSPALITTHAEDIIADPEIDIL
ncbi:MAG: homoserine dehydrogenase, partial [Dehalococcoidia bacterium]|nr:homoserine dehydrogenase [Dehalococcoidia bacterium]